MLIAVNFHYIREKSNYPFQAIHGVSPERFNQQLESLAKEGSFVSQEDICRFIARDGELPENAILITFDDGLREQYELAYPVLQKLGVPAVFYVNPLNIEERRISNVHQIHLLRSFESTSGILDRLARLDLPITVSDRERQVAIAHYNYDLQEDAVLKYILNFKMDFQTKDAVVKGLFEGLFNREEADSLHQSLYMTEEMLQDLGRSGCLGSHTYSHQPLGLLPPAELEDEFEKTHSFFQKHCLPAPRSVSYPYGSKESCAQSVLDLAKHYQFDFGFTMERAGNRIIHENALRLARFDCNDVVGGKCSLFDPGRMFEQMPVSSWEFPNCTV